MEDETQPAEARTDYRVFRYLALFTSRLTIAGLVFLAWYLAAYALWRRPVDVAIFLLTTTMIALTISLVAGIAAYSLFKRRGGRVEKSEAPPSV